MKFQVFAVLLVVAGASALPRSDESYNNIGQRNFVEDQVRLVVGLISSGIQRIGLDPIEVEEQSIDIDVPLVDVSIAAILEDLKFVGLSDLRINNLEYSFIFSRLRLDISLPEISFSLGNSGLEVNFFEREFLGVFKGSFYIRSVRLVAEVHVNAGLEGITLRSLSINFSLGGIESDLYLEIQGEDRSEVVNNFLNNRIPGFLKDNENDINKVLEDIVSIILNIIWSL